MFAAPIAGNSSWHLENRRPRFQALADPNSTSAQFSAGSARFTSVVLPTACLGGGVARKNAATQALTRKICQRREEVRLAAGILYPFLGILLTKSHDCGRGDGI